MILYTYCLAKAPFRYARVNEYWDVSIKGNPGELDHTNIPAKWLRSKRYSVVMAEVLHDGPQGVTKQLCNRLEPPLCGLQCLITGSKEGWNNFFELRCPSYEIELQDDLNNPMSDWSTHKFKSKKDLKKDVYSDDIDNYNVIEWLTINKGQAEIHIMDLAEKKIYDAMNESTPEQLKRWGMAYSF